MHSHNVIITTNTLRTLTVQHFTIFVQGVFRFNRSALADSAIALFLINASSILQTILLIPSTIITQSGSNRKAVTQ